MPLFGTDGVRGVANTSLTPELVLSLGRAAALAFGAPQRRPRFLIATDTRISGNMLEAALTAGLLSAGADVIRCGILPTPAVAFLVTQMGAGAGAVISASHNPVEDNGIKFFGADGFKLTDEQESRIEALMDDPDIPHPTGVDVGREHFLEHDAEERYVTHALEVLGGTRLDGLKVVLDCAHGAAFITSPEAMSRAGADVTVINAEPDGTNINVECGSTHPQVVAQKVVEVGADVGFAHDGDADRVIAVDHAGKVVDGDQIMGLLALDMKQDGRLRNDMLVTTVMSNLGLKVAMRDAGVALIETSVGDRYVLEAMRKQGASLGGEQSGHVIVLDHATTGDGLITALSVMSTMVRSGRGLADLASAVKRFPQALINVKVSRKDELESSELVAKTIEEAQDALGDMGRILVRPSGTESLVRVMVEADSQTRADTVARQIADVVEAELG